MAKRVDANKITATQAKALRALVALGGEANWYSGVPGLDTRCDSSLKRSGLIDWIGTCACYAGDPCDIEHVDVARQRSGNHCYRRVRINHKGRAALAAFDGPAYDADGTEARRRVEESSGPAFWGRY
jgi:hypothetical protein